MTPATFDADEFGAPRGPTSPTYGWLGSEQRETDPVSGAVLMGRRLHLPTLGRFLQTNPVAGGSANPYDYANQDPINTFDLDGTLFNTCRPGYYPQEEGRQAEATKHNKKNVHETSRPLRQHQARNPRADRFRQTPASPSPPDFSAAARAETRPEVA